MDSPSTMVPSGKAAVIVIDNQFGVGPFSADVMNEIGKVLFESQIKPYYDEVVVVIDPPRDPKDNLLVRQLKQTAQNFGVVDVYVHMHTNMGKGLAQIPIKAFDEALSDKERSHLRLLYSMGCEDGQPYGAKSARQLGFDTFLGHRGPISISPLFAYPVIGAWISSGGAITEVSAQTFSRVDQCVSQLADNVIDRWDAVRKLAHAAKGCGITKTDPFELATCVLTEEPMAALQATKLYADLTSCLPEVQEIAARHGKELKEILEKHGMSTASLDLTSLDNIEKLPPMMVRVAAESALIYFGTSTEPIVYGEDISFSDLQTEPIKEYQVDNEIKDDVEVLIQITKDKKRNIDERCVALRRLFLINLKLYSPLLDDLMKEPKDEKEMHKFEMAVERNIFLKIGISTSKTIGSSSTNEFLRMEAWKNVLFDFGLLFGASPVETTSEELSKLLHDKNTRVRRLAAMSAGQRRIAGEPELLKAFESFLLNPEADWYLRGLAVITLFDKGRMPLSPDRIADDAYKVITEGEKRRSLTKEQRKYSRELRELLVTLLDQNRPEILMDVCQKIIKKARAKELKIAAAIYLYDKKQMSDKEFLKIAGQPRSDIDSSNIEYFRK